MRFVWTPVVEARAAMNARRMPPLDLAGLLGVAFALRLGVYLFVPNIHWPDEIYQVMEPAHRLTFGDGAVSWEWALGIRSWLLPGLVAGLMELGRLLGKSPTLINLPVALFMAGAACVPVLCGYGWGRHFFGRIGGFIAGGVGAVWIDLVYMATHTLNEVVAADCLVAALYLGYPGEGRIISRRRLFETGAMLGLTFAFRFHLVPALAVASVGICGTRRGFAPWRTLIAGASVPVLALALLDWWTLGAPLQSVLLNFWLNIGMGFSDEAGTSSFAVVFALPLYVWGFAAIIVLVTMFFGARHLPFVFFVMLTIFVTHALIPHKEYRFIYPAIPLIMILSGLGTADLVSRLRIAHSAPPSMRWTMAGGGLLIWSAVSLWIAESPVFHSPWTRARAHLAAFRFMSTMPELCGVGLYGVRWMVTPGQSGLPPSVPLYQSSEPRLAHDAASFNFILARQRAPVPDGRYKRLDCFAGDESDRGTWIIHLCVWRRDGGCEPGIAPPLQINWDYFSKQFGKPPDEPPGWSDPDAGG